MAGAQHPLRGVGYVMLACFGLRRRRRRRRRPQQLKPPRLYPPTHPSILPTPQTTESEDGRQSNKPPIVLIHGFGASTSHWRYNIPALAESHRVYAIDLLGFGLSDKPLTDYNAEVWRTQLAAFLQEVVGVGGSLGGSKAIVVGNSLGGYTALATAAYHPELVQACAILNGAGSFDPPPEALAAAEVTRLQVTMSPPPTHPPTHPFLPYQLCGDQPTCHPPTHPFQQVEKKKTEKSFLDSLKDSLGQAARRVLLYSAFFYTKQPGRIKQVLQQVYSVNAENVDDELVESIRYPSLHPNGTSSHPPTHPPTPIILHLIPTASSTHPPTHPPTYPLKAAEVFCRVVTRTSTQGALDTVNTLLSKLDMPLLLLWGDKGKPTHLSSFNPSTHLSQHLGHSQPTLPPTYPPIHSIKNRPLDF